MACSLTEGSAWHRHAGQASAADLKFLHRLRQTHFRNFKSKSGTRIICLLVPLLLPKFVSEGAAMHHELRKRGTSAREEGMAAQRRGAAIEIVALRKEFVGSPAPVLALDDINLAVSP